MTNYQRNFSTGEVEIERRQHAVPQDRIPRAPRPLRVLQRERARRGLRHRPRDVPRPVQRLERARRCRPRASRRTRSPAAGRRSRRTAWTSALAPGEEKTFVFTLGYVEVPREEKWEKPGVINKKRAHALIAQFSKPEQVDAGARRRWPTTGRSCSRTTRIESADEKLNRMVNIWNPYQCMVTFNMSRSASYFETGIGRGMGFRDSNQDLLGFVHLVPERARERIIDIASTQFPDGSAYHQYQPLTKRGNNDVGSGFNDDPLWLIFGVAAYIKETGDYAILDEQVPFDNDPKTAASLFEHLQALVPPRAQQPGPARPAADRPRRLERLPEPELLLGDAGRVVPDHRQPRRAGPRSRCSSPACSWASAPDYADLAEQRGLRGRGRRRRAPRSAKMTDVVLKHGWDGEWFLRAYDFFGNKVGSKENKEAQIFIEPQGFCVDGRHRRRGRPGEEGARLGQGAARHQVRHRAQQPAVQRVPRRARRDLVVPARATRRTPASSATTTRG